MLLQHTLQMAQPQTLWCLTYMCGCGAGAVLVVPDHPPMNELVREGSGILLVPHHTFSHEDAPVPALGKYGNISTSMSPEVRVDRGLRLEHTAWQAGRGEWQGWKAPCSQRLKKQASIKAAWRDLGCWWAGTKH